MITLRCTKKLQQHLGLRLDLREQEPSSALGDWYANLAIMPVGPPLILIVNERTLISVILQHNADVQREFRKHTLALLRRLGLPSSAIECEAFQLHQIFWGKTRDRRVLGTMNDVAWQLQVKLFASAVRPLSLEHAEDALAALRFSLIDNKQPLALLRALLEVPARPAPASSAPLQPLTIIHGGQRAEAITPRVPLALREKERTLILGCTFIEPDLHTRLEQAKVQSGWLKVSCTPGEIDLLLDSLAAEANHCESKKLERELDRLYDRLCSAMKSGGDGRGQEG